MVRLGGEGPSSNFEDRTGQSFGGGGLGGGALPLLMGLVGSRFDVIQRDQSRFSSWRKPFAHAIECWTPTEVDPGDMPSVLLLDATYLELLDRERWQARQSSERRSLVLQRERLDALMQRCVAAWPATVLGL